MNKTTRPSLFVVSEFFSPSTTATSQLVSDIVFSLRAESFNISVLTSSVGPPADNLRIIRFPFTTKSPNSVFSKAFRGARFFLSTLVYLFLHSTPNDHILLVSNPPFIVFLGPLLLFIRKTRFTFLYQDIFPLSAVYCGLLPSSGLAVAFWSRAIGFSIRLSHQTVVLSEEMSLRCIKEYGTSLPLTVIPNWAVEYGQPVPKASNDLLNHLDLVDNFVLQYSGNFGRMHDLLTILETAYILKDNSVAFLFIGNGQKIDQIFAYKNRLNLKNIYVLDYVPRNRLPVSLSACDFGLVSTLPGASDLVAPSKYYGIIASGKPVIYIGDDTSKIATEILSEQIGIVIPQGDAVLLASTILQLAQNPTLVMKMGNNASQLYQRKYTREKSLLQYKRLLKASFTH